MTALSMLRERWQALGAREKIWVAGAVALIAAVLIWLIALAPALGTLRSAEVQQRALDTELQQMRSLQAQAQLLQSQPKQNREDAARSLEASVRERLGTAGRTLVAGDRVTVTLAGAAPDALAQWLTQARVNARALPSEAHLNRNTAGLWEGTLVLTLPPR
jgi:general secretion pathway protein M